MGQATNIGEIRRRSGSRCILTEICSLYGPFGLNVLFCQDRTPCETIHHSWSYSNHGAKITPGPSPVPGPRSNSSWTLRTEQNVRLNENGKLVNPYGQWHLHSSRHLSTMCQERMYDKKQRHLTRFPSTCTLKLITADTLRFLSWTKNGNQLVVFATNY